MEKDPSERGQRQSFEETFSAVVPFPLVPFPFCSVFFCSLFFSLPFDFSFFPLFFLIFFIFCSVHYRSLRVAKRTGGGRGVVLSWVFDSQWHVK